MIRFKNHIGYIRYVAGLLLFVQVVACRSEKLLGYLYNSSDQLKTTRSKKELPGEFLTIARSDFDNSYDLSISPKKNSEAENAVDIDSYEILLTASINKKLGDGPIKFISPVLYSSNIQIDSIWKKTGDSSVVILLTANELGKDILLSSLISPGGIRGIFEFGKPENFIPFRANLVEKNDLGAVIIEEKNIWGTFLVIKSQVEYPVNLTLFYNQINSSKINSNTTRLSAWGYSRFRIPNSIKQNINYSSIHFTKDLIYNAPVLFNH